MLEFMHGGMVVLLRGGMTLLLHGWKRWGEPSFCCFVMNDCKIFLDEIAYIVVWMNAYTVAWMDACNAALLYAMGINSL